MPKSKKIILYSFLSVSIAIFLLLLLTPDKQVINTLAQNEIAKSQEVTPIVEVKENPIAIKKETEIQTALEIGDKKYESVITQKISVYDFMNKIKSEHGITFTEKTYSGIGKFIEEINGLRSDGSNYWIYYVNGVEASIGVSNYKINPGDVVSWKYEENKY